MFMVANALLGLWIIGGFISDNDGDERMLYSLLKIIDEVILDCEIVMLCDAWLLNDYLNCVVIMTLYMSRHII